MTPRKTPPDQPISVTRSIRINQDLADKVQALADQEGRSFNNMVARILTDYFDLIEITEKE